MTIGTPYLIGTTTAVASNVSTVTGHAVALGDSVVVCVGDTSLTTVVNSITDPAGNTYSLVKRYNTAGNFEVGVWEAHNCQPLLATDSITINWSAAPTAPRAAAIGCSGIATSAPVDTGGQAATNGTSTTPSSGATGTLAQSAELGIGVVMTTNTGGALSWNAAWTSIASVHTGTTAWLSVAYQITSSTAAITANGTSAGQAWTAMVVTLEGAADAGGEQPIVAPSAAAVQAANW